MIIKELNLIGFGQFNNKIIELKEGLNIIYGENEAGKTTIHNFINGIFYGFLKPYAKRTIYLDEHSKYDPWDNSRYGGIIRFTYGDKEYRIERDFTKNNESTNVILDNTGENITNSIDTGNSGRILQPGYHFFGFNDAVFSNTLSIKQLGNKTEDYLANEVRDRLVNVSTSLDDNLSIEKATESLLKSIKNIGTVRAATSPYGSKSQKLDQLKGQRQSILSLKDNYESLLSSKDTHDNDLNFHIKDLKELESRLEDANILSMEDYSRVIKLNSTIDNIYDKIKEYENTLIDIQSKTKELKSKKLASNMGIVLMLASFAFYSISPIVAIAASILGLFILIYSMVNSRKLKGQLATIDCQNKKIEELNIRNQENKIELQTILKNNSSNNLEELKTNINQKKEEINNFKIEISRLEEQIKYLNNEISKLVEIDEEINRIEEYLRQCDDKIESLELAKSTIENISKDIHGQFAPMINKKVGNIIEDITGGKYSSVKIDNSLEIGVINPETQEIVDINSLSGGTIDQIYFALRFGIVDSINNEALPLILDDCFIQYDDNRLKNIMNFLYKKSKERQIILFTCHMRENKILDEMKVKYNLINLKNS